MNQRAHALAFSNKEPNDRQAMHFATLVLEDGGRDVLRGRGQGGQEDAHAGEAALRSRRDQLVAHDRIKHEDPEEPVEQELSRTNRASRP